MPTRFLPRDANCVTPGGGGAPAASNFRRRLVAGDAELAQLLDQRRAAQAEQARRLGHGATRTLHRLRDQPVLDGEQVCAQVDTVLRQIGRRVGGRPRCRQ